MTHTGRRPSTRGPAVGANRESLAERLLGEQRGLNLIPYPLVPFRESGPRVSIGGGAHD
jgi:hypothetical protein